MKWQTEMKAETDRFGLERKEMSGQMQEIESQLEWLRSERDDEIAKLTSEKKIFQERLHDAESQLSQLKSRKRDELKVYYFSFVTHPSYISGNTYCIEILLI